MYYLYVDTENYSGNFEREMTAFATGQIGDCEVGDDLAEIALKEMTHSKWWGEHIIQQEDEEHSDFFRPVSISPTPGWYNNGMGFHFREDSEEAEQHKGRYPAYQSILIQTDQLPPQEVWDEFQERLIAFCEENNLTLTGVRREKAPSKKYKR